MLNFLARIFRFLFWLLIVSWSVALLRRVVAWMFREARNPEEARADAAGARAASGAGGAPDDSASRRLVRDPVCGVHVAEVLSIPLSESGKIVHFCSVACRDKYINGSQRMAANG